jgi:hypothetical protein
MRNVGVLPETLSTISGDLALKISTNFFSKCHAKANCAERSLVNFVKKDFA